jgi:hypothetical protein
LRANLEPMFVSKAETYPSGASVKKFVNTAPDLYVKISL